MYVLPENDSDKATATKYRVSQKMYTKLIKRNWKLIASINNM